MLAHGWLPTSFKLKGQKIIFNELEKCYPKKCATCCWDAHTFESTKNTIQLMHVPEIDSTLELDIQHIFKINIRLFGVNAIVV